MNATTDEARRSADELIKSLESRKAFIEIGFKTLEVLVTSSKVVAYLTHQASRRSPTSI